MAKKIRKATVVLKKSYWNGRRKLPAGDTFKDAECYEGKFSPNMAKVVFEDEIQESEEPEESLKETNENDLSKVIGK